MWLQTRGSSCNAFQLRDCAARQQGLDRMQVLDREALRHCWDDPGKQQSSRQLFTTAYAAVFHALSEAQMKAKWFGGILLMN
mmetsp:Transcript_29658/g.67206  ORF Transcript_29658/g.67206 Transcript_29658/m.67206 type:complete len:82 (-) Transcript_29658:2439-2684(-)